MNVAPISMTINWVVPVHSYFALSVGLTNWPAVPGATREVFSVSTAKTTASHYFISVKNTHFPPQLTHITTHTFYGRLPIFDRLYPEPCTPPGPSHGQAQETEKFNSLLHFPERRKMGVFMIIKHLKPCWRRETACLQTAMDRHSY